MPSYGKKKAKFHADVDGLSSAGPCHKTNKCAVNVANKITGHAADPAFLIQSQIKQIVFIHLKLWVAVARHNFKWVKI